jgi:hypothetical protein
MAIIAKRDESGNILVRSNGNEHLIFLKKAAKIVDDYRIEVFHFMNPSKFSSYWVMSGLQTNLMADTSTVKEGIVVRAGNGRGGQVRCRYEQPVILAIHDWNHQGSAPQLFSHTGGYLSGSNIHGGQDSIGSYNLCLGITPDITSIDMVDALLFGRANNDLAWRGGPVKGQSGWAKDMAGKRIKIFNVAEWPEIEKCKTTIPKEIYDCANALRK